jgi:hypothetical protein
MGTNWILCECSLLFKTGEDCAGREADTLTNSTVKDSGFFKRANGRDLFLLNPR